VFLSALPTLTITSVGGVAAPGSPGGSYTAPTPDISLAAGTTSAMVNLAASNMPLNTAVTVGVIPQSGAPTSVTSSALVGSVESSTAFADVTVAAGRSLITAEATVIIGGEGGAAMLIGGIAGERIAKVRVGATFNGGSSLTYITASGREIPADPQLLAPPL